MDSNKTVIRKETKNKIHVDYEGKLSFKERLQAKLKTSNTWIRVLVNIFRFVLMLGVSFVILFPFISKIAGSFMTKADVIDPTVSLIAKNFTLEQYKYIITENQYFTALVNTALLSLSVALIQTFIACLVGYGLAKFKFKGNKIVMALVVFTMVVPHQTLSLAIQMWLSDFDIMQPKSWEFTMGYNGIVGTIAQWIDPTKTQVSLQNSLVPYYIFSVCGLAFKNGLYIYLLRQFFKGVPDELEESAYVDGSGVFRTFFRIIIPLAVPMMITVFLFSFSWQWTDQFYHSVFFATQQEGEGVFLMPNVIEQVSISLGASAETDTTALLYKSVVENTAGMMIIAPLIIMYLFCQKYLVQGIERSGLVG
ncbi:MAG: carbohydrate ABC transporter permease [Clostridia bacterium]|nr:carbohydrate ABC transporter permease [Clostridia bacterium]